MPIVFYHMSPANGTKAGRTKQKFNLYPNTEI